MSVARNCHVWALGLLVAGVVAFAACRSEINEVSQPTSPPPFKPSPFNFTVESGKTRFSIEGYLASPRSKGRLPALLVVDPTAGNALHCIRSARHLAALGMHVACISIPGSGRSSGPGRFAGPQAVSAVRRALDLLAERPDVDSSRLGIWGVFTGAMVAGLVMDSDRRPRVIVLQSGAYDLPSLWDKAPLRLKLSILRQVWPSKRILQERSVLAHLPPRLDCSVLILHGERDHQTPEGQARLLELALRKRGARVEAHYFPRRGHSLGAAVQKPVENFLKSNLIDVAGGASQRSSATP